MAEVQERKKGARPEPNEDMTDDEAGCPGKSGDAQGGRELERSRGGLSGYAEEPTPLGGYASLLAAWTALYGGLLAAAHRQDRLPERIGGGDISLLGVATHKLTRIVTKDWVTAPLRAPFVHYEGSAGGGEVKESVRGGGLRKAIGDLLTCPWCSGPWVAGALVVGLVTRPRATRTVAAGFAAVAVSDFLHQAYGQLRGS